MYCSTCGAHIPAGRTQCLHCGTQAYPVAGPIGPVGPAHTSAPAAFPQTLCARCGYVGEGVSYFSKGSHIAGVIALGVISAGMMGLFALIYYFSYRDHRICPRCGKNWGKRAALASGAPGALQRGQPSSPPQAAGSMQGWSLVLFLVAVVLIASGLGVGEFGMVMAGAGAGAGGALLHLSARRNREVRRQALISSLQLPVLQLAAEREGRLTVSQVAASLGWSLPRAEKVLNSLEDGLRISSEVTDEGVIVYEFRELAHAPQRHLDLRELS